MHSSLFRRTMEAFELDTQKGVYLDLFPRPTLATVNQMMLFGPHAAGAAPSPVTWPSSK